MRTIKTIIYNDGTMVMIMIRNLYCAKTINNIVLY